MKNKSRKLLILGTVLSCLMACRPTTPSQYIQPDEMEDLLYDFHVSKAMGTIEGGSYDDMTYRRSLYWHAALKKHGVTEAKFDSSLIYYYSRADRFADMYKKVLSRLQDEAVLLGASEGEIGKYASLNATGDTANLWNQETAHLLLPIHPYHRFEFSIKGDSLFRKGDTFLMQFVTDFVYQSGTKDGLLYLAIDYPDTVVVRQSRFSYSTLNQLRINNAMKQAPIGVRGYFYLGGSHDATTTVRMLFINNIQLIRFHSQDAKPNDAPPTGSLPLVGTAQQPAAQQDGRRDSFRSRRTVLSVERGESPNRMVERIDSLKGRH